MFQVLSINDAAQRSVLFIGHDVLCVVLPEATVSRLLLRDRAVLQRLTQDALDRIYADEPRGTVFNVIMEWMCDLVAEDVPEDEESSSS